MKTTIDGAGRLVIPKKVRDEAGIEPGMELEVSCRDGRIEIVPAEADVQLERRGRFLVAVPVDEDAVLTSAMVSEALRQLRGGRYVQPPSS